MPVHRSPAWLAYTVAVLATLLWIGCALPSGVPEGGSLRDDAGTPLQRQAWVLVPALVLLVLTPAALALTPGRMGRLTILAATDAFIALYAALVLTFRRGVPDSVRVLSGPPLVLLLLLYAVALLSVWETRRLLAGRLAPPPFGLAGARLALCLLVLLLPAFPLLSGGQERASLLAPFLFVAVSAGGARLSRGAAGLGLTGALLHVALAAHVLIMLRYTLAHEAPRVVELSLVGRATRDLALGLLAAAVLQALVHALAAFRHRRSADDDPASEGTPAGAA